MNLWVLSPEDHGMYDYDRLRTKRAAQIDLHSKWRAIVSEHYHAERKDMEHLLASLEPYLKSVGLDLDVKRSYLAKKDAGSDGTRLDGELWVTEREENNTLSPNADSVAKWVAEAVDIRGSARLVTKGPAVNRNGEKLGTYVVDISAY